LLSFSQFEKKVTFRCGQKDLVPNTPSFDFLPMLPYQLEANIKLMVRVAQHELEEPRAAALTHVRREISRNCS